MYQAMQELDFPMPRDAILAALCECAEGIPRSSTRSLSSVPEAVVVAFIF